LKKIVDLNIFNNNTNVLLLTQHKLVKKIIIFYQSDSWLKHIFVWILEFPIQMNYAYLGWIDKTLVRNEGDLSSNPGV